MSHISTRFLSLHHPIFSTSLCRLFSSSFLQRSLMQKPDSSYLLPLAAQDLHLLPLLLSPRLFQLLQLSRLGNRLPPSNIPSSIGTDLDKLFSLAIRIKWLFIIVNYHYKLLHDFLLSYLVQLVN